MVPAHSALDDLVLHGTVVAVAFDPGHRFSKPVRERINLIEGHGVEGDAHAGRFVQHRYLARRRPRLPNTRQVHLIPNELFGELSASGYKLDPGDLGENVTHRGLISSDCPWGRCSVSELQPSSNLPGSERPASLSTVSGPD